MYRRAVSPHSYPGQGIHWPCGQVYQIPRRKKGLSFREREEARQGKTVREGSAEKMSKEHSRRQRDGEEGARS